MAEYDRILYVVYGRRPVPHPILLPIQLTQQDAQLQAQHDRGRIFEANLLKLKAGHIKTEKALKDINKKIDYLGSTVQKVIINGNITILAEEGDGEKAEDGEPIGFDFNFPDASSLGDEHSLTLETDSIMQEIKMNPTLSRNYLGNMSCSAVLNVVYCCYALVLVLVF